MNIASVDLNLLLYFDALMHERSVTKAAAKAGISQPAMSSALARLRVLFGDPLFVQRLREMVPTVRAIQIARDVSASLDHVRAALRQPAFIPGQANLRFRIITTDYVEVVLLPLLWKKLAAIAPGIELQIKKAPTLFELPQAELASGASDLAIGPFPAPIPQSGLIAKHMYDDPLACIVRKDHPRVRNRLSQKQFFASKHVAMFSVSDSTGMVDRVLAEKSLSRHVAISVPNFISIPFMVSNSDLVATIPRRLAEQFAGTMKLAVFKPPVAIPPLRVNMLWHSRLNDESSHRWLRELIHSCVKGQR
jgi:DNA-binding transcriptional LysR family regulator